MTHLNMAVLYNVAICQFLLNDLDKCIQSVVSFSFTYDQVIVRIVIIGQKRWSVFKAKLPASNTLFTSILISLAIVLLIHDKSLKILSYTSELTFYNHDRLNISLKH